MFLRYYIIIVFLRRFQMHCLAVILKKTNKKKTVQFFFTF